VNPLWFLSAASSLFGGVQQYRSGKETEKVAAQQRLMAEENEQLERRELDEMKRRQENKNAQVRGSALARTAASGAEVSGSAADYLAYMETEQSREMDWMEEAGASRIRLNKQAAILESQATKIQGRSQQAGLITGLLGGVSAMGRGGFFDSGTTWDSGGGWVSEIYGSTSRDA